MYGASLWLLPDCGSNAKRLLGFDRNLRREANFKIERRIIVRDWELRQSAAYPVPFYIKSKGLAQRKTGNGLLLWTPARTSHMFLFKGRKGRLCPSRRCTALGGFRRGRRFSVILCPKAVVVRL